MQAACMCARTLDLMRAHASWRSLTAMLSRAMARSMAVRASVATWWPRPRLPLCSIMHTCTPHARTALSWRFVAAS